MYLIHDGSNMSQADSIYSFINFQSVNVVSLMIVVDALLILVHISGQLSSDILKAIVQ